MLLMIICLNKVETNKNKNYIVLLYLKIKGYSSRALTCHGFTGIKDSKNKFENNKNIILKCN